MTSTINKNIILLEKLTGKKVSLIVNENAVDIPIKSIKFIDSTG